MEHYANDEPFTEDESPSKNESRAGSWQLTVIAVILIVASVTFLGPILKPLLSAVFVYFLIRPIADWMIARGVPPFRAYVVLFASTAALLISALIVFGKQAAAFRNQWPVYQDRLLAMAKSAGLSDRFSKPEDLLSFESIVNYAVSPAMGVLEFGLMLIFYLLFLIIAIPKLPDRIRRAYPGETSERMMRITNEVTLGMQKYMEVKTAVNAGMGIVVAAVLFFFRIDYWLLWGALMFALNYVTYLGSVVALVPPIVLAFLNLSPVAAITLTIILIAIRTIGVDYVEVRLSGQHLNVDSILLLTFMAYWGWAWGLVGLVLAMPMATCLRMALAADERTKGLAVLMSED